MRAGGRVSAGALALVSAVAFAALYALAAGTRAGRGLDEDILNNALEAVRSTVSLACSCTL